MASPSRSVQVPVLRATRLLGLALLAQLSFVAGESWARGEVYVDASASCANANGSAANPFCTIDEAIRAASRGDTILIAPGVYPENVLLRKDVDLVGLEGAASTILHPSQSGPVLTLTNPTTHVVSGLTLEGGSGYVLSYPNRQVYFGGGVYMRSASANLTLQGVDIRQNSAASSGSRGEGGGIFNRAGTLTLIDSTVRDNRAGATLLSNVYDARGGGIANGGMLTVLNSTVADNHVECGSGARGAGIANWGTATLVNSTVSGNRSVSFYLGTGQGVVNWGDLTLDHCTVAGNRGSYYEAVATYPQGTAAIRGSVVFHNSLGGSGYSAVSRTNTTVDFSNVEGGWTGAGSNNISVDPEFVSVSLADYRLGATSPCIDAGDPATIPSGLGLGGNPRALDGDLNRTMRVDMGAHEFTNVRLDVSGNPSPGGQLTLSTVGTSGLEVLVAISIFPKETVIRPVGIAFFDLAAPVKRMALGSIPGTRTVTIPASAPTPLSVTFQGLAIAPPLANGRVPSNLSNPVVLEIR